VKPVDMGDESPELLSWLQPSEVAFGGFCERVRAFMTDLMKVHQAFKGLHFTGRSANGGPPLSDDLSNLEAGLLAYGWDKKAPKNWYTNLGADGAPTEATISSLGFRFSITNGKSWDDQVSVSLSFGCMPPVTSVVSITLPRKTLAEFRGSLLANELFITVNRHWPARHAWYASRGWTQYFTLEPLADTVPKVGWLTFLPDVKAKPVDAPAGVTAQACGAGVCLQLGDEWLDWRNPNHVKSAAQLRESIISAKVLLATPES
jgi:hypothetical protein